MKNLGSASKNSKLKRLEKKYKRLVERAYNLRQSDEGLSDIFYFEAEKYLKKMQSLKAEPVSS